MPIIDHRNHLPSQAEEGRRGNRFVNKEAGAANLTIGELLMHHGSALRLHTHPTDEAIILLEGSVEMVVGNESRVVTAGHTLLAPPGTPHRLVNNTGSDARMYTCFPTDNPTTTYVD